VVALAPAPFPSRESRPGGCRGGHTADPSHRKEHMEAQLRDYERTLSLMRHLQKKK